jgi:hypothetical protein
MLFAAGGEYDTTSIADGSISALFGDATAPSFAQGVVNSLTLSTSRASSGGEPAGVAA